MHIGVRLSALDAVADLRVKDDAGPVVDGLALLLAARAQAHGCDPDPVGGDRRDVRRSWRVKRPDRRRAWQLRGIVDHRHIATLRSYELAELRKAGSGRDSLVNAREPRLRIAHSTGPHEHLGPGHAREPGEIRRTIPVERRDRLGDLEAVAYRAAQRLLHVGQLAGDRE